MNSGLNRSDKPDNDELLTQLRDEFSQITEIYTNSLRIHDHILGSSYIGKVHAYLNEMNTAIVNFRDMGVTDQEIESNLPHPYRNALLFYKNRNLYHIIGAMQRTIIYRELDLVDIKTIQIYMGGDSDKILCINDLMVHCRAVACQYLLKRANYNAVERARLKLNKLNEFEINSRIEDMNRTFASLNILYIYPAKYVRKVV